MLFQPWRDETEIIGSSETYLEQFRQLTLENQTIITKMEEYSHKSKELDDAVEKLEEIDDSVLQEQWNHVAPNTHNVENQDGEVKVILPHSHTDPEYNSPEAVELNIGLDVPNTADKESIVINMMKDEDYLSLVRSLNIKQTECF
jgi:predicted P-loop ATPase/GTPase